MENTLSDNEVFDGENADLIYAFDAAPGAVPGESGLVFAALSSGLRRSQDGGRTWEDALAQLNLSELVPVPGLVIPAGFEEEPRVLAGAPGGLFISTDAGQTWKAVVFASPPPTVSALAASPNFPQDALIFAGTMEDGVFISRNGGESWVTWNFGLLDLNIMALAVSPAFAEDETIFAGTETGIFRSINGGRAWREIEMPFGFDPVLSLAFSPAYAADQTIYAGTENQGLWVSRDGGDSWSRLAEGVISDPVNSILVDAGGALLAVTGDALWRSADGGQTWQDHFPEALAGREITALIAPQGLRPGARLLVGLTDGGIETITL